MDKPYVTGDWDSKYKAWKEAKLKKTQVQAKSEPPIYPIEPITEPEEIKPSKSLVFIIGIIIIAVILGVIFYLNYDPSKIMYNPVDIEARNISGLPMQVYFKGVKAFSLSGWESILNLEERDRLFGNEQYKKIIFDDKGKAYTQIVLDNQVRLEPLSTDPTIATNIGWFTSLEDVKIERHQNRKTKKVLVSLENNQLSSNITYTLFKNKPYFVADFSALAQNNSLGDFGLGFVASDYDIYLPNGTILENDNNVTQIQQNIQVVVIGNVTPEANSSLIGKVPPETLARKPVERRGSYRYLEDLEYEIFYKNGTGMIIFSDDGFNAFENMFQWNVFRIYLSPLSNQYSRIYFIMLENASLTYNQEMQTWDIQDKNFNGIVEDYIDLVVEETWSFT